MNKEQTDIEKQDSTDQSPPIHTEESPSDTEMLDWVEAQVKKSSTGVSFDKIPNCEGEMGGFRFIRRHRIDQPCKTLRSAIKAAMEQEK
jgi:hypothetical protein